MDRHDLQSRDDVEAPIIKIDPAAAAPPKLLPCPAIPPKPKENWAGRRKSRSMNLCSKRSHPTWPMSKKHALLKKHGYQIAVSVE
jgi:hypothetical protein